jgi:hypothetical protein
MDPVSALGVAAAALQFVEFSCKLISKGKELYHGAESTLVQYAEISAAAANMSKWSKDLLARSRPEAVSMSEGSSDKSAEPASAKKQHSPGIVSLTSALEQCIEISKQLTARLNMLRAATGSKKWNNFRQALKTVWAKEEIDIMVQRLNRARDQVTLSTIIVVRWVNNFYEDRIPNIIREENNINMDNLAQRINSLQNRILDAINTEGTQSRKAVEELTNLLSTSADKQRKFDEWLTRNTETLARISKSVSATTEEALADLARKRIVNSLYFPQIREREYQIESAHKRTFNWVLDLQYQDTARWSNFASWLQSDKKIYWISGKAASGKSTLTKYLWNDPRTEEHLLLWAGSQSLIRASCFFWSLGTEMQKSMVGLLQTLLQQILWQHDFSANVCPERWALSMLGPFEAWFEPWTESELLTSLLQFMKIHHEKVKICLFIDGLDEFKGNEEQRLRLIELVKKISQFSIKICVSSRPWLIFEDAFGEEDNLRLEYLTLNDIKAYVEDEFNKNQHFRRQKDRNPSQFHSITNIIIRKAQGVFLWVRLVVMSVLEGFRNEDEFDEILERLEALPGDLEEYFKLLMKTLDGFYLEQAAQLFLVMLNVDGGINLMTCSFIRPGVCQSAIKCPIYPLSDGQVSERLMAEERRINARCKGLLQVYDSPTELTYYQYDHEDDSAYARTKVDFLHRTVHNFLELYETQHLLNSYLKAPFDPNETLCAAYLAQLKSVETFVIHSEFETIYRISECFIKHARTAENSQPGSVFNMLIEASRVRNCYVDTLYRRSRSCPLLYGTRAEFLLDEHSLLLEGIQAGLEGCSIESIKAIGPRLADPVSLDKRPPLHYALCPRDWARRRPGRPGAALLTYYAKPNLFAAFELLKLGADPLREWQGHTIWTEFMLSLNNKLQEGSQKLQTVELSSLNAIIELMVRRGVPEIVVGEREASRIRCREVFEILFGRDRAQELMSMFH